MAWQMLVIVAQLSLGGALVLIGFRMAAQYFVAHLNKDHAERLAKALGRPISRSLRPVGLGLLMVLAGAMLLLTIDGTADMLQPRASLQR